MYLAAARERAGREEELLELEPPVKLDDLKEIIFQNNEDLRTLKPYLRWAVNLQFVEGNPDLDDDAEVALIPPISGG